MLLNIFFGEKKVKKNTALKFYLHLFFFSFAAMARVTMTRAAVSNRQSAHSPLDNVTTQYNPVRLLKGAPPGQVS